MVILAVTMEPQVWAATQRSAEDISERVVYFPPDAPLELRPLGNNRPVFQSGSQWLHGRLEVYEIAIDHPNLTAADAETAKRFLESIGEVVDTHAVKGPRTYLTAQDEKVLSKSLLNAASIWLSHLGVPHRLYLWHTQRWRKYEKFIWSLRILSGDQSAISKEARQAQQRKEALLFVPDWLLERGDSAGKTRNAFPRISGLHLVQSGPSLSLSTLPISRIVDPNGGKRRREIWFESYFRKKEADERKGIQRLLEGYIVGPPVPIDAAYFSRFLEGWYGFRKTDFLSESTFASPWDDNVNVSLESLPVEVFVLEQMLQETAARIGDLSQEELRRFFDRVTDHNELVLRQIAQLEPSFRLAAQFRTQRLEAGEPYQWLNIDLKRWVRFTLPNEQMDVRMGGRKRGTLRFVLPLMNPGSPGYRLEKGLPNEELTPLLLRQIDFLRQSIADYKTLSEWVLRFTSDPANRPEAYRADNLTELRRRYVALARAFQVPVEPTRTAYRKLLSTDLDERMGRALRHLDDGVSVCDELLRPIAVTFPSDSVSVDDEPE